MADITYDTLDAVPADLKEFAKQQDGKVIVSVAPKSKLDEFRQTNISVSQERDDLKNKLTRFVGVVGSDDLDALDAQLKELRTTHQRVKDGQLIENTSLEEAVAQRTKQMKESLEEQIRAITQDRKAWQDKAAQLDTKLKRTVIDRAVTEAVLDEKSGANPRAIADILQRAYGVFAVTDDGKLIAKNGDAVIYGEDGATPMSPGEWLTKLREETPYFFKQSNGGNAGGGDTAKLGGYTNEELAKMTPLQRLQLVNSGKIKG